MREISLSGMHKKRQTSVKQGILSDCRGYTGMFPHHILLAMLHSALYCHHTAEIRTVSAGKQKRLHRFPSRRVHSTSDSLTENMHVLSGLHIRDVYGCRVCSLPDGAEVVSVEGRRRVSLLRISGAGVQDSRVEMQGCSGAPAGPTKISVCLLLLLLLHTHTHPHTHRLTG